MPDYFQGKKQAMPVLPASVPSCDTDGCADQRAGPEPTGGSGAGHRPAAEAGRRFTLAFVLAVAAVCVLAGTRNFREAGEQAADLLQEAPVE